MRTFLSYAFALAIFVGLLFGGTPAQAFQGEDDGCKAVNGTAYSYTTGPDTAAETIYFTVGNKELIADSTIKFSLVPRLDGSLGVVATHFLIVYDANTGAFLGTISTKDEGTLTPTTTPGVFFLSLDLTIVAGTDKFKNTNGTMHAEGELDFRTNPASGVTTVTGTVCKIEE